MNPSILAGCIHVGLGFGLVLMLQTGACAKEKVALPKGVVQRIHCGEAAARITFSPEGSILALSSYSGIGFYNVATGKSTAPRFLAHTYASAFAFSPDGKAFLETTGEDTARIWRIGPKWTARNLVKRPGGYVGELAFSPTAPIVALTIDKEIQFWDWNREVELKNCRTSTDGNLISCLTFSPDGRFLAGTFEGRQGGGTYLWDAATGQLLCTLKDPRDKFAKIVTFSPDGHLLACAVSARRDKPRPKIVKDRVRVREMRGEGRPNNVIRVWEAASGQEVYHIVRENAWADSLAFSPKGWLLAASCNVDEHDIDLWDARTGEYLHRYTLPEEFRLAPTVAFSPDGKLLATSIESGCLLWDVATHHRPLPAGPELSPAALDRLWSDLASDDIKAARQSVLKLAASPRQSVSTLSRRLKAAPQPDSKRVKTLIADLDSDDFKVRQRSAAELAKYGGAVRRELLGALAKSSSEEAHRRLNELIERCNQRPIPPGDTLRKVRALKVLEHIGNDDAMKILRAMADGAPGAAETEDAKATLKLLTARRPAEKP